MASSLCFSVGIFETAIALERFLERVKQSNPTGQRLYLHYLKKTRPHSYKLVLEKIGRRNKKGSFCFLGIGDDTTQVPFAALH
jgi:hypothetical protein